MSEKKSRALGLVAAAMLVSTVAGAASRIERCSRKRPETSQAPIEDQLRDLREREPLDALSVHGVVLREGSRRWASGVPVQLTGETGKPVQRRTDDKGRFRFPFVAEGRHAVTLVPLVVLRRAHVPWAVGRRGGPRIELVMPQPCLLLQRSFSRTLTANVEVRVAAREKRGGEGIGEWDPQDPSGVVLGAAPGEVYDILLRHRGSRRAGLLQGLTTESPSVLAQLGKEVEARGRVELPPGVRVSDVDGVLAHHGLRLSVRLAADGRFYVPLLPAGVPWVVTFRATVQGETRQVTRGFVPGRDDLVLRLR